MAQSAQTLIRVTVTPTGPRAEEDQMVAEMLDRTLRGGMVLLGDMTWGATQAELDTPHETFRLAPR